MLAVSQTNSCHYCTAAHSAMLKGAGVAQEDVAAINKGDAPKDARLRVLVQAAKTVLAKQGHLGEAELAALKKDGVDRGVLYEIFAMIGLKTFSNFVNHVNHTEIDPQFRGK